MRIVCAMLLFDGCDVMDVTGPYEVLLAASRLTVRDGAEPAFEVRTVSGWVDDGDVLTAGGISSGVDAALHLVERLAGRDLAERTARQIDHTWREDAERVSAPRSENARAAQRAHSLLRAE